MTGSTEISFLAAANEGGGAEIGQVIGMTVVALVIGALLCWLGGGEERSGALGRLARGQHRAGQAGSESERLRR